MNKSKSSGWKKSKVLRNALRNKKPAYAGNPDGVQCPKCKSKGRILGRGTDKPYCLTCGQIVKVREKNEKKTYFVKRRD